MPLDASDPLVILKISCAVCSTVAIATTVHRLFIRRGRYWADDAWALVSMFALFLQIAAVFMHLQNPTVLSRSTRIAAYYLMATTFYVVIWTARLSILFSIIRVDPSENRRRRLLCVAALFILVLAILIAQLYWVCEPEPRWKDMRSPQCTLNKEVAICQLVSDVIADLILILAPLKLLSGLEDKGLRHRLMVIFSTCVVTTIVSLVHAAYILTLGETKVVISAIVEDCVSLIVCNVPVVVTAAIRIREESHGKTQKGQLVSTFLHFATRVLTHKDTAATHPHMHATAVKLDDINTGTTGISTTTTMVHSNKDLVTFELDEEPDLRAPIGLDSRTYGDGSKSYGLVSGSSYHV
ncbi:hypothetical protein ARMSODRAFT_944675 [Armillaria solidipes]|uniref:Rhodopsin domain-containing protein n=1 Tax=Armillaria solidipes TaxID=1076256 RepID=A0A2H3BC30_9AGAR|nr:hypothetical protein ARMSODRAFT_944675 [Armillaria solidipes]